jgi:23S rRNA (pseudouridine1915-N3)-methyltransferase
VKIQIIRTGKVAQTGLTPMAGEYRKRLNLFLRAEEVELKADAGRDKRNAAKNSQPLYVPSAGEFLVLLDERGRQYNSQDFAQTLQGWIDDPRIKTLSFLIGPPYGFDDATREAACATWSLSAMTIPSDFAWVLCWEQIYRAMTILKGMPYHHD